MAKQVGSIIKEARKSAGLTQAELGEKIGVSAKVISKAEHDEKELTADQLKGIAEATGVDASTLLDEQEETAAEVVEEEAAAPEITDEELLTLFKSADPATQNAAVAALKGEKTQDANPMAAMMNMFGGMINQNAEGNNGDSSEQAKAYFANMANGENGEGANPMAAMMSMFGGMMGGQNGEGGENPMAAMMGGQGGEEGANPMAAMMSMFGGMMGGQSGETAEEGGGQEEKKEE